MGNPDEKQEPIPLARAATTRADGWSNIVSGLGTSGKDKRLGSTFNTLLLAQEQCEELWRGDDIASRCVETLPAEMCREGYDIRIEDDKETAEALEAAGRLMGLDAKTQRALEYGRAYGGAGLLLGADDGASDLSQPLNEKGIKTFDWVNLLSPRELKPWTYYGNMLDARYGEVKTYKLIPFDTPPMLDGTILNLELPTIHESRIIRIAGSQTSRGQLIRNTAQPGWDDSIFIRLIQIISDFQATWQGVGILLQDFATPTLKIKGLAQLLASAPPGDTSLATRVAALELCRSIARVAVIDSEEEYKRETTTVAGLADLLDKMCLRLAAAVQMPVSLLMGQAPAGLNATGDADIRWFYDQVAAKQEKTLKPILKRLYTLKMLSKNGPTGGKVPPNWDIEFRPLWQHTELEKSDIRLKQSQADVAYIGAQVLTPEEVAKSRFGGDAYSTETQLDVEARDAYTAASVVPETPAPTDGNPQPPEVVTPPSGSQVPIPGAGLKAATAPKAADSVLSGQQVSAIVDLLHRVAQEELPRESGVAILVAVFNYAPEQAEEIMGPVGKGFKPKEPPAPVVVASGAKPKAK